MTHIQNLSIAGYGCIKRASFLLTPLHALIGPNDSGKSTALRALRTVSQFAAGTFEHSGAPPLWKPFDPMLESANGDTEITIAYPDGLGFRIRRDDSARFREDVLAGGSVTAQAQGPRAWNMPGILHDGTKPLAAEHAHDIHTLKDRIASATMARFDPDCLREPTQQIPEHRGIGFVDDRGSGLASVLDAILKRDVDAFTKVQGEVRGFFPSVSKVGIRNVSESRLEVAVTLTSGERIGARAMSEGMLYFLGFAVLKHLTAPRLFLVEEPENGLHPSRIADVMRILREISKESQVVIATHSPLVVNELEGDEITVVTRDAVLGTKTTLLEDVPGFDDAAKVYQPGEFWVSYADGKAEEPLLTGKPRS